MSAPPTDPRLFLAAAVRLMATTTSRHLDRETWLPTTRAAILAVVNQVLEHAALEANSSAPVARIPAEILCYVARYLPYRDLCTAVEVCVRWRKTLLADTRLWTHIFICMSSNSYGRWLSKVQTLVARSAGRPLTLELECWDRVQRERSPQYNALSNVAYFLADHMHVMKSLSLAIPTCVTFGFRHLLVQRAPMLEVLRVRNHTSEDDTPMLPLMLFDGHAPRLHTLYLEQTYFPDETFAIAEALTNVTTLNFHINDVLHDEYLLDKLDELFPNLRRLTCTVLEEFEPDGAECALPLEELQVNVEQGVMDFIACFPNARPGCTVYSFQGRTPESVRRFVREAVRAVERPVTSVDIAWTPKQSRTTPPSLSLSLNGRPVIIDIPLDALRSAMTSNMVGYLASRVRTLTLVEEMWKPFASSEMPALEELGLYVLPREDWLEEGSPFGTSSAQQQRKLKILRLVGAASNVEIPGEGIANFVRTTIAPGSLPTLLLCGVSVADEEADLVSILAERVVYEPCPEPTAGMKLWEWSISAEDAVIPRENRE